MAVNASPEKLDRSSKKSLNSSSQSRSSGVVVTRPRSNASEAAQSTSFQGNSAARALSSPHSRDRIRVIPFHISIGPKLLAVRRIVAGSSGTSSSSNWPASIKVRSAAKASSRRTPTKHDPGSITAISVFAVKSSLARQRFHKRSVSSRASKSGEWKRLASATASSTKPSVLIATVPISGKSKRRRQRMSSSSLAAWRSHSRE